MKRYLIKNCPAIYNSDIWDNACNDLTNYNVCSCENTSDCLLKRIFNIVKDEALIGGINQVAENVLELLEIEVCEK